MMNYRILAVSVLAVTLLVLYKIPLKVTIFTTRQETKVEEKIFVSEDEEKNKGKILLIPDDNVLHGMSEDDMYRLFNRYINTHQVLCRNTARFGPINDFGKDVCIDDRYLPQKPCIVYSFGSKLEFQFEEAVLKSCGCEVHTFDPSIPITDKNRGRIPKGVHYHEIGIDGRDFVNNQSWTMRSLQSVLKDLHHENSVVDLLKMDAEGGEWSGFQNKSDFKALENTKQLLVELHFGRTKSDGYWGHTSLVNQLRVLRSLYEAGFRICMKRPIDHLSRPISSYYGPRVATLAEMSFINMRWKQ